MPIAWNTKAPTWSPIKRLLVTHFIYMESARLGAVTLNRVLWHSLQWHVGHRFDVFYSVTNKSTAYSYSHFLFDDLQLICINIQMYSVVVFIFQARPIHICCKWFVNLHIWTLAWFFLEFVALSCRLMGFNKCVVGMTCSSSCAVYTNYTLSGRGNKQSIWKSIQVNH